LKTIAFDLLPFFLQSGIGPRDLVQQVTQADPILENPHIGSNLQDHWVGRASATVPGIYAYPRLYLEVLGYKHRFKDIALGFGKIQMYGSNMISFATTQCKQPGKIILGEDNTLQPYLPLGNEDHRAFRQSVDEITEVLDKMGVSCKLDSNPLSPNWHLCCTTSLGTCVEEDVKRAFELKGVKGLHVADISVMKKIIPMNTQIVSYLVAYIAAENL
jgi:hypothetical protein